MKHILTKEYFYKIGYLKTEKYMPTTIHTDMYMTLTLTMKSLKYFLKSNTKVLKMSQNYNC